MRVPLDMAQCHTVVICIHQHATVVKVRGMHYDWYSLYQGGMVALLPDSEEETYKCTRHQYVCYW